MERPAQQRDSQQDSQRKPRNLLFITTDQQRWDSLPCYGLDFIKTPNLDRLVREGVVFERAYTPAPVCVPMRAALLTGQWPSSLGVLGNNSWFREGHPGLACWPEELTAAGYRTAGIGKMHFHPWDARYGFTERISAEDKRQFFWPDDYSKFLAANGIEKHHPTELPQYFETHQASVFPHPKRFHVDGYVGDQAADWLRRYSGGGNLPFAAWVSFPGPHDPYDPPEEMASMYYDAPIPDPIEPAEDAVEPVRRARGVRQESPLYQLDLSKATREHHRRWRAHYYANITLIDEGIGKMLAALEETGALEDTTIVFTSDHGDALGDHGMAYKSFFYDWAAHVPLIVRGPTTEHPHAGAQGVSGPGGVAVARGQRCASLVSTLDMVPLFYRACGLEAPEGVQGRDPSAVLADPSQTLRASVVSELAGRTMVRDDRFKYVQYRGGVCELFDLVEDPQERRNLAADAGYAGEVARLRGLLVEHFIETANDRAQASRVPDAWHRAHQRAARRS